MTQKIPIVVNRTIISFYWVKSWADWFTMLNESCPSLVMLCEVEQTKKQNCLWKTAWCVQKKKSPMSHHVGNTDDHTNETVLRLTGSGARKGHWLSKKTMDLLFLLGTKKTVLILNRLSRRINSCIHLVFLIVHITRQTRESWPKLC